MTRKVGIFTVYDYIPKKPKRIYGKTTVNKSIALQTNKEEDIRKEKPSIIKAKHKIKYVSRRSSKIWRKTNTPEKPKSKLEQMETRNMFPDGKTQIS